MLFDTDGPVLVLAAHPDDEVLGCGGTLARLSTDGIEVTVAFLTDGVGARVASEEDARSRWSAAIAAANIIGYNVYPSWSERVVPDNEADTVSRLSLAKAAESLIESIKPSAVLTHSLSDLNVDHRRAHEAVLLACRPRVGQTVRDVLAFEVPSSTEWGARSGAFSPTFYVDIDPTLSVKCDALACYVVESPAFPHPRSEVAVVALARWRGSNAGFHAAEAFEVVRCLR